MPPRVIWSKPSTPRRCPQSAASISDMSVTRRIERASERAGPGKFWGRLAREPCFNTPMSVRAKRVAVARNFFHL